VPAEALCNGAREEGAFAMALPLQAAEHLTPRPLSQRSHISRLFY
jgi:hypothetical protein